METVEPPARPKVRNLIPRESLIAAIKPFKPDSFLNDVERSAARRDRKLLKADREIAIAKEDEEEELEERREKERAEFADEAAEFRNLQLRDEKREVPLDGMEKAREQLKAMQAAQQKRSIEAGKPEGLSVAGIEPADWVWQGPGNIGGRVRSMLVHPVNTNTMWIGSVGGGIWKTVNAGTTWFPVNDFLANLAVSTMVIDPTNPNIMYAGTGEGMGNTDALRGDGIYKSTDGGFNWNQLPQTKISDPVVCPAGVPCPWLFVNRLTISPDGSTILAATNSAIRRSTDGGATWTRVTDDADKVFYDVDFAPTNSQLAIAGADGSAAFTTDGGQTWGASDFTPDIAAGERVEIAYAPSSPNIIYASVDRNGGEVFRSTDGGQTFAVVNTGTMFLGTQGFYANIIWVNPQDPAFVIVGGLDLWRSTDSGQNFAQISRWQSPANVSPHADHHMIVAAPGFNNTTNKNVYFGNDGGIYRASDVSTVGQTTGWTNLNNGLGITQFYSAAANSAGLIIGGTQDNGNLRSDPVGFSGWTDFTGGDGGFVAADPTNVNYFYTEYIRLTIQRSTNAGGSASFIYCDPVPAAYGPCTGTGIMDAGRGKAFANFIAPFILDPNEPNRMLAGGINLWRSNNIKAAGIPSWSAVKSPVAPRPTPPPGPDPTPTPLPTPPISAISVAQAGSDFVVVGHNDGQIYLSQDGTAAVPTWNRIDNGTPERYLTRLAIDETHSPRWIYATFGGFSADNVYRTEDLGTTWTDITGAGVTGLPEVPVRSIVVNPANPNRIYVGTEIGMFASEDAGVTWLLPQDGPANVSVDELFFNQGKLVAATHGRGVYKIATPLYGAPKCSEPTATCTCAGQWNCACSWPNDAIPTAATDVVVSCPMTVGNGVAKSLRVNSDLRLAQFGQLNVTEDINNFGILAATPITGGLITARNVVNTESATLAVKTLDVTGDVVNGGMMSISDLLEASRNIRTTQNSTLTAGRIYAGGDFLYYSADPLVLNTTLQVGGNLHNEGRIQGTSMGQVAHYSGGFVAQTFSGPGVLKFNGAGTGTNVTLANDKTFEAGSFYIGGPLNLGTNSMAVSDNTSFGGTGSVTGTGTIYLTPRTGVDSTFSYNNANFLPTLRILSGTVVVPGSQNLIGGPLIIDAGATLALNWSNLTTNNDVTVNGRITTKGSSSGFPTFYFNGTTFTNNGEVSNLAGQYFVFGFNQSSTPRSQTIVGTGSWSPTTLQLGASGVTTVTLMNDMTFAGAEMQVLGTGSFDIGANTFTHSGSRLTQNTSINGTGTFKIQPVGSTFTVTRSVGAFTPGMKIASGTVSMDSSFFVGGPLVIDSGATLSLNAGSFFANGDVTVNGTITGPSTRVFYAQGNATFTNNGSITTGLHLGPFSGTNIVTQSIGGTGTWGAAGTTMYIIKRNTVTLLNDVTFSGGTIFVEGPGVRMNTGAFTFSLPCNTIWQSTGEISGNIRRTNLAACPGAALTFGNPFTTIQFTSGTPPTDIRVATSSVQPVGFPNAVSRSYLITPTGGSGYAATLRLRYLDSELNGNNESTLQLWRNDGSSWAPQGATSRDSFNNWVEFAGVTQFSPWAISGLAPTAARVGISGRVATAEGSGITNVRVSLTDQNGNVRTAVTGSFGYYRFDEINAGQTVVISVASKRYLFANPTRILSVVDDLADIDFTAEPR